MDSPQINYAFGGYILFCSTIAEFCVLFHAVFHQKQQHIPFARERTAHAHLAFMYEMNAGALRKMAKLEFHQNW